MRRSRATVSTFCLAGARAQEFHLLELSVGGKEIGGHEGGNMDEGEGGGGQKVVLLSVRRDGRVSIDGGGGVVVKDGDLEVSNGDATFKVLPEDVTFSDIAGGYLATWCAYLMPIISD